MEGKDDVSVIVNVDMHDACVKIGELKAEISSIVSSIESMANQISGAVSAVSDHIGEMDGTVSKRGEEIVKATNTLKDEMVALFSDLNGTLSGQAKDGVMSTLTGKAYDTALALLLQCMGSMGKAAEPGGGSKQKGPSLLPAPKSDGKGTSGLLGLASNADMLTAGLLDLTTAWDAETIAKAASTAAQWAQTAAVTAWNGICGAASAVTTAFGAAMNFLTSPIMLVVLGIAALIAIVVLLVKNWDTVKAALITGWEAVKQAFITAGEWFNTNVIQPLVGFFTGLWDQICLIVTNVTTFISTKFQEFTLWIQTAIANVQAVFMGIGAYLQGAFASDWTTQFGVFGEVLNVFFANVENIWNAVKTIFNGIVEFVKGVFAGDWQAAWDGIVQVFTGIWEGLQAAIKGPINGIIGMINGLVSAVVSGINGAIRALNAIRFTIPSWFPGGGGTFGFSIPTISAPRIPYLAQGAVLPANRPFLAVVGDQRSGTNVEAPLATIQEALANVLAQQGPGDIRISFTGDLAQLARVLKPVIDRENRRTGASLAKGVAV